MTMHRELPGAAFATRKSPAGSPWWQAGPFLRGLLLPPLAVPIKQSCWQRDSGGSGEERQQ